MFGIHIVSLGKKGHLMRLEIQLPTHLTRFPVCDAELNHQFDRIALSLKWQTFYGILDQSEWDFFYGNVAPKGCAKLTATNTVSWNHLESHPTESLGQKPHSKTLNLDC